MRDQTCTMTRWLDSNMSVTRLWVPSHTVIRTTVTTTTTRSLDLPRYHHRWRLRRTGRRDARIDNEKRLRLVYIIDIFLSCLSLPHTFTPFSHASEDGGGNKRKASHGLGENRSLHASDIRIKMQRTGGGPASDIYQPDRRVTLGSDGGARIMTHDRVSVPSSSPFFFSDDYPL